MTTALLGSEVSKLIAEQLTDAVVVANDYCVVVKSESFFKVAEYLKNSPDFDFDYLNYITVIDYFDKFELVYQLTSLKYNHSLVLKTQCYDRYKPIVPSVVSLWRGADYQEREIYDLMGISFEGHPNLKRIVLWDGFEGHPLRKDYL